MRCRKPLLAVLSVAIGLALAGCESFDGLFDNKKPLPGERRAVFPQGVPGVPQGVPPELVQGYVPPPEPEPAPPPKPVAQKPKPKPRPVATAQRPPSGSVAIQPAGQAAAPSPFPPASSAGPQAASPFPPPSGAQRAPSASPFPDPPPPQR